MKKVLYTMMATTLFVIAFASLSLAQAVGGEWEATITSPQGAQTSKLVLKQEGETLSGTLKGERGELPVKGTVKGDDVKIMFTIKFQDNDFAITLSGKLAGDAMKGPADFGGMAEGDWSAKRAGGGGAAPAAAPAAKASGAASAGESVWDVVFSTPNGDVSAKLAVKQDGENLSGMVHGQPPMGDVPLKGTLKGDVLEIKYTIKFDGNDLPITMKGKVMGAEIKGSADYGGMAEGEFKGKKSN